MVRQTEQNAHSNRGRHTINHGSRHNKLDDTGGDSDCCCGHGIARSCWMKYMRRCMCTTGWVTFVVAIVISIGFALSLYSTTTCRFITVNVGFTPSNSAWDQERADLGLFMYFQRESEVDAGVRAETITISTIYDNGTITANSVVTDQNEADGGGNTAVARNSNLVNANNITVFQEEEEEVDDSLYDDDMDLTQYLMQPFHQGCMAYTDAFDSVLIARDRTWKVARTMAIIATTSALIASIVVWAMVFLPLPLGIWPLILLPATMISFIAEGSKFLIFDVALCRNAVWFPTGVDSLPEQADSCTMGPSAYVGVAAGVVHMVALVCVCWRAPVRRRLRPETPCPEEQLSHPETWRRIRGIRRRYNSRDASIDDLEDQRSLSDDEIYTCGPTLSPDPVLLHARAMLVRDRLNGDDSEQQTSPGVQNLYHGHDDDETTTNPSSQGSSKGAVSRGDALNTSSSDTTKPEKTVPYNSLLHAQNMTPPPSRQPPLKVSESRTAVMHRLYEQQAQENSSDDNDDSTASSTPRDLLAELVLDLDQSLTQDEVEQPRPNSVFLSHRTDLL